ncbi:MAG: hypothetical protein ACPIE8_08885, partial [Henriciella sp.]
FHPVSPPWLQGCRVPASVKGAAIVIRLYPVPSYDPQLCGHRRGQPSIRRSKLTDRNEAGKSALSLVVWYIMPPECFG